MRVSEEEKWICGCNSACGVERYDQPDEVRGKNANPAFALISTLIKCDVRPYKIIITKLLTPVKILDLDTKKKGC